MPRQKTRPDVGVRRQVIFHAGKAFVDTNEGYAICIGAEKDITGANACRLEMMLFNALCVAEWNECLPHVVQKES